MKSILSTSPHRNSQSTDEQENRRVAAIVHVARHCTPRQIASLVSRAVAGDEDVIGTLAWDRLTVEDLQTLLKAQGAAQILNAFRWTGTWVGTDPRLFLLTDSEERGIALIEREQLDPYRVFIYIDAAEVRRDVTLNAAAGVSTEVIIIGGERA